MKPQWSKYIKKRGYNRSLKPGRAIAREANVEANGRPQIPQIHISTNTERQVTMFSVIELRLIRYSVKKTMEKMKSRLKILDPESDDAVGAKNDLMLYENIIEKIDDRSDV